MFDQCVPTHPTQLTCCISYKRKSLMINLLILCKFTHAFHFTFMNFLYMWMVLGVRSHQGDRYWIDLTYLCCFLKYLEDYYLFFILL